MKELLKVFLSGAGLVATLVTTAQPLVEGAVSYDAEIVSKMSLGEKTLEQNMSMKLTRAFSGGFYRTVATLGSQSMGSGINISGGTNIYQYYAPGEKKFYQLTPVRGTNYAVLVVNEELTDIVITGKKEFFLGYECEEFTCNYSGEAATGWYSKDLPALALPIAVSNSPGGLLKFESKNHKYIATEVVKSLPVKKSELKLPDDAVKVTREEFMKKISGQ